VCQQARQGPYGRWRALPSLTCLGSGASVRRLSSDPYRLSSGPCRPTAGQCTVTTMHSLRPRPFPHPDPWKHSKRIQRLRGFTLVELLITVAIVGILLAIGVPAMQQFLAEQAAAGSADELANDLRLARAEALKRGIDVSICSSTTSLGSAPVCSTQGDDEWVSGWLIVDVNGNVLRIQNAMRGVASVDSSAAATVTFRPNGLANSSASFVLTPSGDGGTARNRTVSVGIQGRVAVVKGSGS